MSQNRSGLNLAFYLICLGIIYGSLFPFQFALGLDKELLGQFLRSWSTVPDRGDILGNSALFMPYGLAAFFLSTQPGKYHNKAAFFIVTWLLLAAGCQTAQLFIPSRDPSIFDLYGNALGALLGWTVGRFMPAEVNPGMVRINAERQLPLVLALFWLASELIPFVPTIDFQAYKNALKPLLLAPHWSWQGCLLGANCWVACFYLVHHGAGLRLRTGQLLSGVAGILALKVVIVENNVSLTDVVAMVLALVLWSGLKGRHLRADLLGYSLLASFSLYALSPLMLRVETATFGWIPFAGYLQGSMLINATVLCRKLFVFGAMAVLILQNQPDKKRLALLIAAALMTLEVLQIWIGFGTPELTDPLLFLVIAWLCASVGSYARSPGQDAYQIEKQR